MVFLATFFSWVYTILGMCFCVLEKSLGNIFGRNFGPEYFWPKHTGGIFKQYGIFWPKTRHEIHCLCNQTRPGGVRGLLTQRVSFVLLRVAFKIRIDPNFVVRVVSCRATRFHCPRKGPYEPGSGKVSG
jgi:hypothetical protein